MPSLKLKKATMLTSFLLLSPIVLTSLYFIPRINNYHYVFFIFVMMSCWIIGGVNLFLSTKIESKFLKRIIIFLNLICILGWLFLGGEKNDTNWKEEKSFYLTYQVYLLTKMVLLILNYLFATYILSLRLFSSCG